MVEAKNEIPVDEQSNQSTENEYNSDKEKNAEHATKNSPGIKLRESLLQKIRSKIPPLPLLRIILKASIAVLIGTIFVFEDNCRNAIGSAAVMVPIATFLYFPIKPIGVQIESTLIGLTGVLVGSGWCALGMYLANLARDMTNPSPVQPHSSAVLSMFMLIGVFVATYTRVKLAQVMHGAIFLGMIVAFSLTQASLTPGFQKTLVLTFLKPHLTAAAISFMVDIFIWPEDSITKYLGVLSKSLTEYNNFFQEQINGFTSTELPSKVLTLPTLHASLQNSLLKVIDCKREVQREILYNQLSQDDVRDLTRLFKAFSTPLHGIGLSLITKVERLNDLHSESFYKITNEHEISEHKQQFLGHLEEMRSLTREAATISFDLLNECNQRLMSFSGKPRTWKSTFLWPFPRFVSFIRKNSTTRKDGNMLENLDRVIAQFDRESHNASYIFIEPVPNQFEDQFNGLLQVIFLFRFHFKEYLSQLREFVAYVERMEETRVKRKLSFPKLPLHKWFRSIKIDVNIGAPMDTLVNNNSRTLVSTGEQGLQLVQTTTRPDPSELLQEDIQLVNNKDKQGRLYIRDPDVNPPETSAERFFLRLYGVMNWFTSVDTFFAFKTAAGFVLLSLPAFLPQSAGWFYEWRGQWATFTLVLWMFPISGMFFYTTILRVIGSVIGGVLGIIVWEIVRGNPFGLAVLNFFVMMPLYYLFFTKQAIGMGVIMVQITNILVLCYEYEFKMSGAPVYDSVEMVAGKRILLVLIGVGACAILSLFPKPVTGRVELRKRISKTLNNLSELYGILAVDILTHFDDTKEPTENQQKAFRKLALGIRRQIADERTFLKMARMEPPLRGKFPIEIYTKIVEKVDNMADLIQTMAFSARAVDKVWKKNLVLVIKEERMEYLAAVLSIMKILSSTLASKMALPPFMLSPDDLRKRLAEKLSKAIRTCPERLDNDSFPSYCAYAISSNKFALELEYVVACVEQLVGVEDPEQWLLLNV